MQASPAREAWGVLAACLAAVALRLFRIGHPSLWIDECFTWYAATPHGPLPWGDVFQTLHGPFVQVLLHGWTRLAGDSEVALRVPFALASAAIVPVFAVLARRLLGRGVAVGAAWMAALAPFLVWYGQEARGYAFAMLFSTVAAWAAVAWHQERRAAHGAALVVAAWLGVLSNLNVAFVVPVYLAYVALPHDGRPGRPRAALAVAAALVVLETPWLLRYVGYLGWARLVPGREALPGEVPLRGVTTFSWGALPYTLWVFSVGYGLGPSLRDLHQGSPVRAALAHWPVVAAGAALFGALAAVGLRTLARTRGRLLYAVALLAVPLLAVTYVAIQNLRPFNPRYVSSGIAGYLLIVLAGWWALGRRARAAAAVLVAGLWLVALANQYANPAYGKDDYRAATRWLAGEIRSEDQLIAAGTIELLDYYWRGREPRPREFPFRLAADPPRMRARFEEMRDPARTAYVVVVRPDWYDAERRFESYLESDWGARPTVFPGVTIYRLPARAAPQPERPSGRQS